MTSRRKKSLDRRYFFFQKYAFCILSLNIFQKQSYSSENVLFSKLNRCNFEIKYVFCFCKKPDFFTEINNKEWFFNIRNTKKFLIEKFQFLELD